MPLRDHFRPPLDDLRSSDGLYGGWPAVIVQKPLAVLPDDYFAEPTVHLGTLYEVDIGTFYEPVTRAYPAEADEGGVAVASYAPPRPTVTLEPRLPNQDVYEVRIYDTRRQRQLVAAIEIVSPSNKDRPESRSAFVAKAAALLKQNICVSIVDVVTTKSANLYADLLRFLQSDDPALNGEPPPIYAATLRLRPEADRRLLDGWYHPLELGRPLPTLPIWLTQAKAISLDLEASYEETCRTLRIR